MSTIFETVREQIDIVEFVERYAKLKKVGQVRQGRCPLPDHDDSSPSFCVYDDYAHCFGCDFHGDVVNLWAAIKGFQSQFEAALDLAREYNITLPARDPEAEKKAAEARRREDDYEVQAIACHEALSQHPEVITWWESRGFTEDLRRRFILGSNRDGSSAVIPFWSKGRIKGLVRRQLNQEPKYLLPKAEDFTEGHRPLFIPAKLNGDLFLVEGYVDALSVSALGYSAIAIGGTGINERQKAELQRLRGAIYILPDADEEGAKASRNWLNELYPHARLCSAEYGEMRKDAADLFRDEGENAKAVIEALKSRSLDALDLAISNAPEGTTREKWRYTKKHIIPLLLEIEDEGDKSAAISDVAKALGLKASDLQRSAKPEVTEDKEEDSAKLVLHEPERWSDPVDGATLLDETTAVVSRFLSASEQTFKAVALWVIYSYAFDVFDTSPLLAIVSPEKRCGKTTLLTLLNGLVPRPLAIANITASALFRTVEKYHPTLLIDEADSFLTDNEELRGILNSGHRRATAYVIRTVGDEHEPRRFTTWTPKAIALIGNLPGTLEDRAVIIRLERKRANDNTERLRYDALSEFEHLRQRAVRWIEDQKETLRSADPVIPHEITNDRARDNWRPLLAIADAAGKEWPQLAREVALAFSRVEPEAESTKILLLRDLKTLFDEHGERLESENIITALIEIEGRPWAEVSRGKPLSKIGLARFLKPFGIKPQHWREGNDTKRGYLRSDFIEVFARYIDFQSAHSAHATESTAYEEIESAQAHPSVPSGNDSNSNEINTVPTVPSRNADIEEDFHCPPQMSDEEYARRYASRGVTNLNTWLTESKARADARLGAAIWRSHEGNQPVTILADLGTGADGRRYVSIQGSDTGIPLDEIQYETLEERAERKTILDYNQGDDREIVLGVPQGGPPVDESLFEV